MTDNDPALEQAVIAAFSGHQWYDTDKYDFDDDASNFCPICCTITGDHNLAAADKLPWLPLPTFGKRNYLIPERGGADFDVTAPGLYVIPQGWHSTANKVAALKIWKEYHGREDEPEQGKAGGTGGSQSP